jgi:hypothetical protein
MKTDIIKEQQDPWDYLSTGKLFSRSKCFEIRETTGLDRITVLTEDYESGAGRLILISGGRIWHNLWLSFEHHDTEYFVREACCRRLAKDLGSGFQLIKILKVVKRALKEVAKDYAEDYKPVTS